MNRLGNFYITVLWLDIYLYLLNWVKVHQCRAQYFLQRNSNSQECSQWNAYCHLFYEMKLKRF